MDECKVCSKASNIGALEENVKTLFKISDRHDKALSKLDERMDSQYKLSESIAVMAEQMLGIGKSMNEVKEELGQVKKDVGELRDKVKDDRTKELEKEASKWEKYKWHVLLVVTTGIISYLLGIVLNT